MDIISVNINHSAGIHRIKFILDNIRLNDKIINIGSNNGTHFKNTIFWKNITNVDIDKYNISNFVQADAADLPFEDKSFNVSILADILEHVPDPVVCIKEANRVSDQIIISVPNEYEWDKRLDPFGGEKMYKYHEKLRGIPKDDTLVSQYTGDNLSHLWHNRYYDAKLLSYHLNMANLDPSFCYKVTGAGWSFFLLNVMANDNF